MGYQEDDFIMLSALQHMMFCPRQCYLIHVEQIWADNYFTVSGDIMHEKVDQQESEYIRPGVRLVRALQLKSERLGLSGRADLVEFNELDRTVLPVEYKLGKPKPDDCDLVQLCAQALCLEEMLQVRIDSGAIYYGRTKHRLTVELTADLKVKTEQVAESVHQLFGKPQAPKPIKESGKCQACSLKEHCLPILFGKEDAISYLQRELEED